MVVGREVFVSWLVIQELYAIGIDTVKGERRDNVATHVARGRKQNELRPLYLEQDTRPETQNRVIDFGEVV